MEQEHSKNEYRHWMQKGRNVGEKMETKSDMQSEVQNLLTKIFKLDDFDHPLENQDPRFFEALIQQCIEYYPKLKAIHHEAIQYDKHGSHRPDRKAMLNRHKILMLEIRQKAQKEIGIQECFEIKTTCEKMVIDVPGDLRGPVDAILKEKKDLNSEVGRRPNGQTAHVDRLIRFIFWLLRKSDGVKTDHTTVAGIKIICECAYEAKGKTRENEFRDGLTAANIEMADFDEVNGYFTHPFLLTWSRFQEAVAGLIPTKSENCVFLLKNKTDQLLGVSVIWNAYEAFRVKTRDRLVKQTYHQILQRILVGDTYPMQNTMLVADDKWGYKIVHVPVPEERNETSGEGSAGDYDPHGLGSGPEGTEDLTDGLGISADFEEMLSLKLEGDTVSME